MGSQRRRLRRLATEFKRAHPRIADPEAVISSEGVVVDGFVVKNPASLVRAGASIALRAQPVLRGEPNLRAALEVFSISAANRVAADLGAAAGGFTRVLLEAGASRVYAVDAGFGQLVGSLRQDVRVVSLERTNLGDINRKRVPDEIDIVTVDLSYVAEARAAPQLAALAIAPDADLVALVKPMFELGLPAPPTVLDELAQAVARARAGIEAAGWTSVASIESPVLGRRGAVEYLVHARPSRA